jgi:hypothetical protein
MLIRFLLVVGLSLALSACSTHAYLPLDGQLQGAVAPPAELKTVAGTAATRFFFAPKQLRDSHSGGYAANVAVAEARSWFGRSGGDYKIELSNGGVGKATGNWLVIPYAVSLGLIPVVTHQEFESTLVLKDSDGAEIFRNSERYKIRGAFAIWPTALLFGTEGDSLSNSGISDQMNRHKLALGQHIAVSRGEYEQAVSAATVDAYRAYLEQHPASFYRQETLRRLAALAPAQNALRFHIDNVALEADYLRFIPGDQALWFVGPEGLRVHDVLTQSRSQAEPILAARIRTGGAAYKVFTTDEIERLQQSGMKPGLVAAMMEVSAQKVSSPAVQPAPGASVVTPATMTVAPAAAPEDPTAGDIAAQCAKRLVAMQACDRVPSLGRNVCRAQVQRTYDHIACAVIQ